MIVTPLYIVTGKVTVDDDVIFTRRLQFIKGVEPAKLVIVPKAGAPPGAQRVLKIVADVVDSGAGGDAEITFNLDGDLTLPLVDTGLDPETKAKNGADGTPSWFQGLGPVPPDLAPPTFDLILDPTHFVGPYPRATDGGNGDPGGKGGKGVRGTDAPIVEIWTKEIDGDGLVLDLRGQEGGDGGKGGDGRFGGNGQGGSTAVPGTEATWIGVPNPVCKLGPGLGGDGGRGGDAGCGGDGGDGGNGGVFKLFYTSSVNLSKFHPQLQGGKGGKIGPGGKPGKGGKQGPAGFNIPPCTPALASTDGPDGRFCRSSDEGKGGGGVSLPGQTGLDGFYFNYTVTAIPQIPGLWP